MSKFYCAPVFVSINATTCNSGSFKAATFFHHLILAELQYYFFKTNTTTTKPQTL